MLLPGLGIGKGRALAIVRVAESRRHDITKNPSVLRAGNVGADASQLAAESPDYLEDETRLRGAEVLIGKAMYQIPREPAGEDNKHSAASRGHNGEGLEGQHRLGTGKRSNGAKRAEIGNRDFGCAGQVGQLLVGHGGQKMKEFGIREIIVVFSIIGAKPVAHGRLIRARVRCKCRQGLWLSHDDLGRRGRTSYGIGEHRSGD